jgi:hypothetical protein
MVVILPKDDQVVKLPRRYLPIRPALDLHSHISFLDFPPPIYEDGGAFLIVHPTLH